MKLSMMVNKFILFVFLLLLFSIPTLASTTVILNDSSIVKDAYVSSMAPDTNFGTAVDLQVRSSGQGRTWAITWNISQANIPTGSTNILAIMNVTTVAGNAPLINVWDSGNTTWNETNITFNTFFCTFNASFQVTGGQCDVIINTTTFLSPLGSINQMDVSSVISDVSVLKTFVVNPATSSETSHSAGSRDAVLFSDRPTLTITFDEPLPPQTITELDVLNITGCMDSPKDMALFEDQRLLYVWGADVFDEKVAVINATNPENLILLSCKDFGDISPSPETITFLPSTTANIDGFLILSSFSSASTGITIVNLTGGGSILTTDKNFGVASGFAEVKKGNTLASDDDVLYGCDFSNRRLFEINRDLGTTSLQLSLSGTAAQLCKGLSPPVPGETNAFHFVTQQAKGQSLIRNFANLEFSDATAITTSSRDRVEGQDDLLSVGSEDLVFYLFANGNVTEQDTFIGFIGAQVGNAFVGIQDFITTDVRSGAPFNIDLFALDITNLASVTVTSNISTGFNSSPGIVTLVYDFPNLFMMASDTPQDFVVSYEFTSDQFNVSNNKKPVIENLASPLGAQINQDLLITYSVNNPETALIGEKILTNANCEYNQNITFLQDFENFNFSAQCNSTNIGVVNGVDFGVGLDLSACFNDIIAVTSGSVANNTIMSFDIFVPEGQSATTQIDLIQFDGQVIQELFIDVTENVLTLRDGINIILENITLNATTGNIPTRIFTSFNPITTNTNLQDRIFYSTNFFSRSTAANVDKTFCDANEFCYIGQFSSSAAAFNNFFALLIDDATGNITMDNFKVVTTNEYPLYLSTTNLNVIVACNFTQAGDFTFRAYASDELFGHNYLAFADSDITASITGIIIPNETLAGTSGLGEVFTLIAGAFVGSDPGTLILISLLFIGGMTFGGFVASGSSIGGLVMFVVFTMFFFFVNWLPLIAFIILILIAVFAVVQLFRMGFGGME